MTLTFGHWSVINSRTGKDTTPTSHASHNFLSQVTPQVTTFIVLRSLTYEVTDLCIALLPHLYVLQAKKFQMELWRCFNIHVCSWNDQVKSNVNVSRSRGATPSAISIQMVEYCQTWKGKSFMYELHKRLILVHKGEQSVAEDTITRGGEEEVETWKKLYMIDIIKFLLFSDNVKIWHLPVCQNTGEAIICRKATFSFSPDNPLSFSVPFNHFTYWVTETNGARLKFISLPCG